jgi:hypothetical protein
VVLGAACASISSYYAGRGRGEKHKQCEIVQHVMNNSSCDCCRKRGAATCRALWMWE